MQLVRGVVISIALACSAVAQEAAEPSPELAGKLRPAFVVVEVTLQRWKGQDPWFAYVDKVRLVTQTPVVRYGLLVDDRQVLCPDLGLDGRFVAKVAVRPAAGEPAVSASIEAYAVDSDAVLLRLAKPVPGATPLRAKVWRPKAKVAFRATLTDHRDGYALVIDPARVVHRLFGDGQRARRGATRNGLLVTSTGVPVGMGDAIDRGLFGHPSSWPLVTHDALSRQRAALSRTLRAHVARVELTFRPPARKASSHREPLLRWDGLGLRVPQNRVVVFADLKPRDTARLKRVRVHGPRPVEARFRASLERFGAFVVELDAPQPSAADLGADLKAFDHRLTFAAGVQIAGEKRTDRINRWRTSLRYSRIGAEVLVHTSLLGFFEYSYGNTAQQGTFVYGRDGRLLGVPLAFREGTPLYRSEMTVAVSELKRALADLSGANVDPNNRPLSEADAKRLAWLGVEMQPLTPELAREAKVLSRTHGGNAGAMIVHVYSGSPAAKAKLQEGDIVLKLRAGQKTLDVQLGYAAMHHTRFPWKQLGNCPDGMFEHLPKPWPPAETDLTRALTDHGFGKTFTLEVARDGRVQEHTMTVTRGPLDFESAPRTANGPLGVTVAEVTYEVRRVLRMKPKAPGVVVAKIERGSKMSVAGLKPYEVVTHVNDRPIRTVAEFREAVAPGGALRFSVKRLHLGRLVKVSLPVAPKPAAPKPAAPTRPATAKLPAKPLTVVPVPR